LLEEVEPLRKISSPSLGYWGREGAAVPLIMDGEFWILDFGLGEKRF
jgi:hypothetical protein